MSDHKPFVGSPFTEVDLEGGVCFIVALPRAEIRDACGALAIEAALNGSGRMFADVPVLRHDIDDDSPVIELATIRLDLIASLVPFTPKTDENSDAVLALGDARRADPEPFQVLSRLAAEINERHAARRR